MSTAQLKDGHVSVPEDISRELDLHEGDQLEAHVVAGGMFLRRAAGSPAEIERAWDGLFSIIRRPKGPAPVDARTQEEDIAAEIKASRKAL